MIGAEEIAAAHLASVKAIEGEGRALDVWFVDRQIDQGALGEHAIEQAEMAVAHYHPFDGRTAALHAYYLGLTDGWHLREVGRG